MIFSAIFLNDSFVIYSIDCIEGVQDIHAMRLAILARQAFANLHNSAMVRICQPMQIKAIEILRLSLKRNAQPLAYCTTTILSMTLLPYYCITVLHLAHHRRPAIGWDRKFNELSLCCGAPQLRTANDMMAKDIGINILLNVKMKIRDNGLKQNIINL